MQHDEWQVKENISQLKQLMSDQNLQLLPDYEQRVLVLKELGFVDEQSRVQLKGKVACEVWLFQTATIVKTRISPKANILQTRFILPMS